MTLNNTVLKAIDEALFQADIAGDFTLQQLDDLLAGFGLESVFKSHNPDLIAKARAQRLVYYCDYQNNDNELFSCIFVVSYQLNIDKTLFVKDTLKNVLIENISYSLLNCYDEDAEAIENSTFYISDLDKEIQKKLKCQKNLSERERKELLKMYVLNGF